MSIDVDALKASVDIVSVIGSYIPLKKRGHEYVGICPFHADKNPSFSVNPRKGFGHCFSCGANKDVIEFVQDMDGITFVQACEKLGAQKWEPKRPIKHEAASLPDRVTSKPPADAERPDFTIRSLGEPSAVYEIKDVDGSLIAYECRYEAEGKKEIRIWSWGARGNSAPGWGVGHLNQPRPLYGLERLAEKPQAQILMTEGPKKADAGAQLLPLCSLSITGGANAWHKHDFAPIRGRQVLIWPDADEPGKAMAEKMAALLADPKGLGCKVRVIKPNGQAEGWDIADAHKEGWDSARTIAWAKEHVADYEPPAPAAPKAELPPVEPPSAPPAPPSAEEDGAAPASMSEDMLADHLVETHAEKWRYVKPWGAWFEWRGDGWYKDETAKIDRIAVEVTRQALYWPEAAPLSPDGKRRINSKRTAGAVRDLAMSDRRIAALADQWDTDPWLLGVPGGVVDLRTGKLHEAKPTDYMTKRCRVKPEPGPCPLWLEFLGRITERDQALVDYLQRFAGYSLTGITSEHALAFLYGTGANGKTTFIQTISQILGDYALSAGFELLAESKNERHPTEIARLRGARLVITEETDAGGGWNEGRIKRLTGGGKISAHFMRQDDFEFEPQFKLLIAGNHKPRIKAVDEAIKRRIHLVPFTVTIPPEERDKALLKKLEAEWPQILHWCIQGCLLWQDASLSPGERILEATEQYVEAEDVIGAWIADCCEREGETVDGRNLFDSYRKWCEAQGEHAWSRRAWSNALLDRGFAQTRSKNSRGFDGISLKAGANLP